MGKASRRKQRDRQLRKVSEAVADHHRAKDEVAAFLERPRRSPEWIPVPKAPAPPRPVAVGQWRPSFEQAAREVAKLHRAQAGVDDWELRIVKQLRRAGFSWARIAGVFSSDRQTYRRHVEKLLVARGAGMEWLDARR